MSNAQGLKDRVNELLKYDPTSGVFTWKVGRQKAGIGKVAGSVKSDGYVQVMVDGRRYYAHRLAWLITTGKFPTAEVDHIDGDRSNNAIANPREATKSQNSSNKRKYSNHKSGCIGVSKNASGKKWIAAIKFENVYYHIGSFTSAKEAAIARDMAAMRIHLQFAKLNFKYEITSNNEIRIINETAIEDDSQEEINAADK